MPVRSTIVTTLQAQLALILTASGYATDVVRVNDSSEAVDNQPTEAGKFDVDIIDEGEGEVVSRSGSGFILKDMFVDVRADAIAASYGTVPDVLGHSFISDIEKIVGVWNATPWAMGANVRYVEVDGNPGVTLTKRKVIVHVRLQITYFIDEGSP